MIPRSSPRYRNGIGSPQQQLEAVLDCIHLLQALADPEVTPRIPGPIRAQATALANRWPAEEKLRRALESEVTLEEAIGEGKLRRPYQSQHWL